MSPKYSISRGEREPQKNKPTGRVRGTDHQSPPFEFIQRGKTAMEKRGKMAQIEPQRKDEISFSESDRPHSRWTEKDKKKNKLPNNIVSPSFKIGSTLINVVRVGLQCKDTCPWNSYLVNSRDFTTEKAYVKEQEKRLDKTFLQ